MARLGHLIVLWLALQAAHCVRYEELFPHGAEAGDSVLDRGDNISVTANLQQTYSIFGADTNQVTISTDGYAEFGVNGVENTTTRFMPFFADVDTTGAGYVSWRETSAPSITSIISSITNAVFPNLQPPVNITSAVLIVWIGVGYYRNHTEKLNTFELVVAADDQGRTYGKFVYVNDRIQWTTGDRDGGQNGLGGNPARVGIRTNAQAQTFITGSSTSNVIRVHEASNTGLRGLWYWRVDSGTAPIAPDAQQCVIGCDTNAACVDRTIGYACSCNDGFEGEDATTGSCRRAGAPGLTYTLGVVFSALIVALFF